MTVSKSVRFALMLMFATSIVGCIGTVDPINGTWEINVSASRFDPGPVRTSDTRIYTSDGKTIHMSGRVTFVNGSQENIEYTGAYDGKDYPVAGNPRVHTIAQEFVDLHTVKTTTKRDGKITSTSTRIISLDGKTMTITFSGIDEKGVAQNNVLVFQKR